MPSERGVSDVVAFVLSFSIIITSVALTSALGFTDIEDRSADIRTDSADSAMQGIANAFGDIHRRGAESRSSELRLGGGSLRFDDSVVVTVRVEETGSGNSLFRTESRTGSLEYRSDDSLISYENGALFRRDQASGTSLLRAEPAISCRGDTAIVSVLNLTSDEDISTSGQGSVVVAGTQQEQRLLYQRDDTNMDVTVTIGGPEHTNGWKSYFQDSGWSEASGSGICSAKRVLVRETRIEITTT